jgi:hypothetical protein
MYMENVEMVESLLWTLKSLEKGLKSSRSRVDRSFT